MDRINSKLEYDIVMFDLDGTLSDPGLGLTNSLMHALNKRGIDVPREELYSLIGPPLIDSFMNKFNYTYDEALVGVQDFREYFSTKGIFENILYEGIPELLIDLKKNNKKIILATSKPDEFSIKILKYFNLYQYFDFIAAATMDEKRTNKDEVIEYACQEYGIEDRNCVIMVGDREHDILGAKKCGIRGVGVSYGFGSREELENIGSDYIVDSVSELHDLLL